MIQLKFSIELNYEVLNLASDFIINIHAAQTARQTILAENLFINQQVDASLYTDPFYGSRYLRFKAQPGSLKIVYDATVDIVHYVEAPANLFEVPITALPPEVLRYIYPSRYCQSDRLHQFASREFGQLPPGYSRVLAIRDWVNQRTAFKSGSTNSFTSALETITEQAGVCRDFAHLMIALCRAVNIPARFVSGIDYGADPILGPMDFHAYVEVFLTDRWYLFDPSGVAPPMGLVRLGTGRDAADVSFATMFGSINSWAPMIEITALEDSARGYELPRYRDEALSTQ